MQNAWNYFVSDNLPLIAEVRCFSHFHVIVTFMLLSHQCLSYWRRMYSKYVMQSYHWCTFSLFFELSSYLIVMLKHAKWTAHMAHIASLSCISLLQSQKYMRYNGIILVRCRVHQDIVKEREVIRITSARVPHQRQVVLSLWGLKVSLWVGF